ncbi:MAG: hypothetical protein QNJ97_13255 [Myxococcota bacterium]|nr:hypothetical protein [Myxococcota bacterium]
MDNLKKDELEIVVEAGNPVTIQWLGVSQFRNPSDFIDPYFEKLVEALQGKEVVVDFANLKYMNSSTVSPIIKMCRLFDEKSVPTTIVYNKSSDWQAATFKALISLSRVMKHVKVA